MTRIRPLLICLLAAVFVISLPEQKWELPSLPAAPVPQQWTGRMTAVGRIDVNSWQAGSERAGRVLSSAPAVVARTPPGRAAPVVTAPVLARGWEHSNGDVPGLANVDAHAPLIGLLNPSMQDETVVCMDVALNCGYASPKKGALPLSLRRSGAGIALTISNTDIFIEPGGVRFSRSVSF